ncbi:MAG: chemotaxis-specific protein-glutamate methyltransferase CheB, partial [Thermoanaerobaculia bacterium]
VTLTRMLESDRGIEVVGAAVNGEDGIKQVIRHQPDVITLDLEMPVMDGFAFLRWIMANKPTAVIAVSSRASDRSVFKALELGAVDFIAKPGGRVSPRLPEIQKDLVAKVHQVAEVRMENLKRRVTEEGPRDAAAVMSTETCPSGIEVVTIGSSTGGPPALQHVFENLPLLPLSFVVAQHMPPTFTRLFAERLDKLVKYEVKEAADGDLITRGRVFIAPGGMQTEVVASPDGLRIHVSGAKPQDLYRPSVERLFRSASEAAGEKMVAIVLTGMGDDGSRAIRQVKERGGKTVAESAETAIIYGMPREAIKSGGIDEVLPLQEIPAAIQRLCGGN